MVALSHIKWISFLSDSVISPSIGAISGKRLYPWPILLWRAYFRSR